MSHLAVVQDFYMSVRCLSLLFLFNCVVNNKKEVLLPAMYNRWHHILFYSAIDCTYVFSNNKSKLEVFCFGFFACYVRLYIIISYFYMFYVLKNIWFCIATSCCRLLFSPTAIPTINLLFVKLYCVSITLK